MDDRTLLRQYAATNSEAAFEELVSRYVRLVYSAALRQMRDPDLAQDVTQAVFIILAQKASRMSDETILSGWLFRTTRFVALAQSRAAARRRQYEQESHMQSEDQISPPDPLWEQMSPLLDEALAHLSEKDRQSVLLRFFEDKSLMEVGRALGTGEDAARVRISRALEKLHHYFTRRGIASTTAIIVGAISANSVHAAPVALARAVTAVAVAKGAAASGSTLTLINGALKLMAWTKAQTAAVVVATVLATAGTTTVIIKTGAFGVGRLNDPRAEFEAIIRNSPQVFNNGLNAAHFLPNPLYTYPDGDEKTHHYVEGIVKKFRKDLDPAREIKSDRELTEQDIQNRSIYIYGSPQNHSLFQRLRDQLPIVFEDDGVVVGKKKFVGQDVGAIFDCPNPINPGNRLVIYGTVSPAALNEMNSIFHGPTDFVVFNNVTRRFGGAKALGTADCFLLEGAFDKTDPAHWRVDEKLQMLPSKALQRATASAVASR